MPIRYKIDVIKALKEAGYNTGRIRREKIFGESTLQSIRKGIIVNADNLEKICRLLEIDIGELLTISEQCDPADTDTK